MTKPLLTSVALLAALASAPAVAANIDAKFDGRVATQSGTAFNTGSAISGEFVYRTESNTYLSFTIGGVSILPGYSSLAQFTLDQFSALYQAQVSPVQQGGAVNSTFGLDLEGLNKWTAASAVALLTDTAQLAANLDTAGKPNSLIPSTFSYYVANADGTNIRQLSANLTSLSVSVPEPASLALLATVCVGLLARRRRDGTR